MTNLRRHVQKLENVDELSVTKTKDILKELSLSKIFSGTYTTQRSNFTRCIFMAAMIDADRLHYREPMPPGIVSMLNGSIANLSLSLVRE